MWLRTIVTALAPLLASACSDSTITSERSPKDIYEGESSTITAKLRTNDQPPSISQRVTFKVTGTAADFNGQLNTTVRSATDGTATAQLIAKRVDRDTDVPVKSEWEDSTGLLSWDLTHEVTVVVHPKKAQSPKIGEHYIEVIPSVTGALKYRYEIQARTSDSSGSPPDLRSCTFKFEAPVTMTSISATHGTTSLTAQNPVRVAPDDWHVSGGADFTTLVVEATASDASPGGTATITCLAGNDSFEAKPTGPKP
jgi:hypothetical protein